MRNITPTLLFLATFCVVTLSGCGQNETREKTVAVEDKTLCQFNKGECHTKSGDLNISLSLLPDFAPSEEPIEVKITTDKDVTNVNLKVTGRDMFMGIIPVTLNTSDNRNFTGQMIYGSCSSGYMVWRATLSFVYQGEQRQVWFDFLADAPTAKN
ncbi:MAG: hypothetical protein LPH19_06725 [Shewanella sp.]|nr:hypothetical protein [Shewanella sp.]MCF1430356.1 hypothetical protein [Shewanella sp.]